MLIECLLVRRMGTIQSGRPASEPVFVSQIRDLGCNVFLCVPSCRIMRGRCLRQRGNEIEVEMYIHI